MRRRAWFVALSVATGCQALLDFSVPRRDGPIDDAAAASADVPSAAFDGAVADGGSADARDDVASDVGCGDGTDRQPSCPAVACCAGLVCTEVGCRPKCGAVLATYCALSPKTPCCLGLRCDTNNDYCCIPDGGACDAGGHCCSTVCVNGACL